MSPAKNLGFGAGVNRGLAALAGMSPPPQWVIVSNPDLHVHPGALDALRAALEAHPAWALVGPRIYADEGERLPVGAPLSLLPRRGRPCAVALFNPENPFTRRYNPGAPEGEGVVEAEWISGSCFLARRKRSRSWVGSTRPISCTPRTWTCAGGRTRPGWGIGFTRRRQRDARPGREHGAAPLPDAGWRTTVPRCGSLSAPPRAGDGSRCPLAVVVLGLRMGMATARLALRSTSPDVPVRPRLSLVLAPVVVGTLAPRRSAPWAHGVARSAATGYRARRADW